MLKRLLACPVASSLRRFRKAQDGLSAVEFAMVLPILILLFFGTVELTQAVSANRRLIMGTRAGADLTSQSSSLADADFTDVYAAVTDVLSPYSLTAGTMIVSGISIDTKGVATVSWSKSAYATPRACGSAVTLPSGIKPALGATGFVVLSEGTLTYTPTVGYVLAKGGIGLSQQLYMRPRVGSLVTYSGSNPCQKVL